VIVTLCVPIMAVEPAVSVTVAVVPGVIDAGLMMAVTPGGALIVKATALFAELLSVTPTVNVVFPPIKTVPDVADCDNVKFALVGPTDPVPQLLTSNAPSTDPSPVARLYALSPAVNPVTPGTLLFPESVSWNGLVDAFNSE